MCEFYHGCSVACLSKGYSPYIARANCYSSVNLASCQIRRPSPHISHHYIKKRVVYAKPPFGGPEAVLAYLSRYTLRVAISNSRLVSADANTVVFKWKDYRAKDGGKRSVMRLATDEFIRRFLIHVLPDRFHRIRHYGLLASSQRKTNIAKVRALLGAQSPKQDDPPAAEIIPLTLREPCPD